MQQGTNRKHMKITHTYKRSLIPEKYTQSPKVNILKQTHCKTHGMNKAHPAWNLPANTQVHKPQKIKDI